MAGTVKEKGNNKLTNVPLLLKELLKMMDIAMGEALTNKVRYLFVIGG